MKSRTMLDANRFLVDMCSATKVECIYCSFGPCENRHGEWRERPWSDTGVSCRPGDVYVEDMSHAEPHVSAMLI